MKQTKQHKGRSLKKAPELRQTDPQVLELWVRAGGWCEFHGCDEYLLQDKLTTVKAKLANIAHIVAQSKGGPRGDDSMLLARRNDLENLFLACPKHHLLFDKRHLEKEYPKELLLQYKQAHEERIRYVTSLGDEHSTTILRLISNIRGNVGAISNEEIREAVLKSSKRYPRYLGGEHHIEIDLRNLPSDTATYWTDGAERIRDTIARLIVPATQQGNIRHLSVFGLARIPFLVYLGHVIGDKVPLEIYQKQRTGSEGWVWSQGNHHIEFGYVKERDGHDGASIAVKVSLSGKIVDEQLPPEITDGFTVYSLSPTNLDPSRTVLSTKDSLDEFRKTYAALLRDIEKSHSAAKAVHVFPAVPVSAAVLLGRELLRNMSPSLILYDLGNGIFTKAIEIDTNRVT